ncbi:MAG TPA: pentapeptide repeat-containing protein [Rhodobacteraceae bacterium]|nr:pentapeptide repeat-containing protein [Paracoccaceae bacterium]
MFKDLYQTIAYSPLTWFAVLCALVLWALNNVRLGKPNPWKPTDTPWLNGVLWFAALFSPVLLVLFLTVLAMLALVGWQILGSDTIAKDPDNLRWYVLSFVGLLTALGGIIGTPLALIRIWTTERQTATQEEALFNDKINAASEALAARRQVTRVIEAEGEEKVLTEWQDDIVTRSAAIDRLEGLVHECPEAAGRVASLLSVYVVELSREHPPQVPPKDASPDDLGAWARKLTPVRSDMERAVQTLGRLAQIEGVKLQDGRIDLRGANLQGFDLRGLDFSGAKLALSHLDGANASHSSFERSDMLGISAIGINLECANLSYADLSPANTIEEKSYLHSRR